MMENELIIKNLEELGFHKNDAIIYLTLLKMKMANPTQLSKKSKITRARVYDSLNRLMKKGLVVKDNTKRVAGYYAISPNIVLKIIREELKRKIKISQEIEDKLKKEIKPSEETQILAFKFDPIKVRSISEEIIQNTDQELFIISPEVHVDTIYPIIGNLIKSSTKKLSIKIILTFNHPLLRSMDYDIPKEWKIQVWHFNGDIPLGMITNGTSSILLFFQNMCIFLKGEKEVLPFISFMENLFNMTRSLSKEDLRRESEFKYIISKK